MMANGIEIIVYDDKYKDQLESLLRNFSNEIYGTNMANIDKFVNDHWVIYLALRGVEVIGFSSFVYNTYFGLRPPSVGNTYLYVKPAHRRGRASYLLSKQAGFVSIDTNLPLENYYASDDSRRIGTRMNGTKQYDVWLYPVEEVKKAYQKLKL